MKSLGRLLLAKLQTSVPTVIFAHCACYVVHCVLMCCRTGLHTGHETGLPGYLSGLVSGFIWVWNRVFFFLRDEVVLMWSHWLSKRWTNRAVEFKQNWFLICFQRLLKTPVYSLQLEVHSLHKLSRDDIQYQLKDTLWTHLLMQGSFIQILVLYVFSIQSDLSLQWVTRWQCQLIDFIWSSALTGTLNI